MIVIALWASTPVLVDRLNEEKVGGLFLLTWTSTFAAVMLLGLAAATGRLRQARSYSLHDWARISGMGLLGIVGYTSLYYTAFRYAPADEVNVVNYLWPVFLVLFSAPLLGERHDFRTWAGVGLSFLGAAGVLTGWRWQMPTATNLQAYFLAASGAVCWALFSVLGKRLPYDKLAAMALYCLMGAVVFGVTFVVFGSGSWLSPGAWAKLIFLGAIVNGIAYFLWFEALAGGPTALFGNLVFVTPFLALVYLHMFGNRASRSGVWLSLALIVAGSLISLHKRRLKDKGGKMKEQC